MSKEPLSLGKEPSLSRTTMVVFLLQVGKTLSTVSSLGVICQTLESPVVSTVTLNDSIAVALFSMFKVTFPDSPPMSTTWEVSVDNRMLW